MCGIRSNYYEHSKADTEEKEGWICPRCGQSLSPLVEVCSCVKTNEDKSDLIQLNE